MNIKLLLEVVISISFICVAVIYTNRLTSKLDSQHNILMRYVMTLFASIVALFIADKAITIGTPLLTDAQGNQIFDLIKTMTLMIFAYYFGTKSNNDKPNENK